MEDAPAQSPDFIVCRGKVFILNNNNKNHMLIEGLGSSLHEISHM